MSDPVIPPSSDARTALRALIQQKDVLEAQLEALSTQANAGQELVDAEGFPRADLDVHTIRNARAELARLQTDHKQLMASIERAMFALHKEAKEAKAKAHPELVQSVEQVRSGVSAATPAAAVASDDGVPPLVVSPAAAAPAAAAVPVASTAAPVASTAAPVAAASSRPALEPFYTVNSVSEDSPAGVAGLRVGDLVLQFGSVTRANKSAASMAAVVSSSIGRAIPVTVRRDGAVKELRLIPQAWGGRGMLGCHLVDI